MPDLNPFDRRIRIERATYAQDAGSGQEVPTWNLLTERWASWRPASAKETLAAAEVSAEVTDVFEVRWSALVAGVTAKDRIVFGGKIYNIAAAVEVQRRELVRITASARADQ